MCILHIEIDDDYACVCIDIAERRTFMWVPKAIPILHMNIKLIGLLVFAGVLMGFGWYGILFMLLF